nr:hypothetical protein [Tanacetum cinerariifolium]
SLVNFTNPTDRSWVILDLSTKGFCSTTCDNLGFDSDRRVLGCMLDYRVLNNLWLEQGIAHKPVIVEVFHNLRCDCKVVYHDLCLGGKALAERENVGLDLTKSDICPSFIEHPLRRVCPLGRGFVSKLLQDNEESFSVKLLIFFMDSKFIIVSQTCALTKDELSHLVADYDIPKMLGFFFQRGPRPFLMLLLVSLDYPILFLTGLKSFWKYSPKKPIIYHRGKGRFFDGEGNSPSNKFVNNEALVIGIAPLNFAPPSHITDNVRDSDDVSSRGDIVREAGRLRKSLKATGKRKLATGPSSKDVHHKLGKVPPQASKVAGDASDPLDIKSDPNIHDNVLNSQTCQLMYVGRGKLIRTRPMLSLRGNDQATMVSKVVPNVATKLICSDQMECLITKLFKATMFRGECQAFEEVASLKGPFILENMPGYRSTSK